MKNTLFQNTYVEFVTRNITLAFIKKDEHTFSQMSGKTIVFDAEDSLKMYCYSQILWKVETPRNYYVLLYL